MEKKKNTEETTTTVEATVQETAPKKTKFQQRMEDQAQAAREAYARVRDVYDNPTDEQILAEVGNNIRGYQWQNNKNGNWTMPSITGVLGSDTRKNLENDYLASKQQQEQPLSSRRAQEYARLGDRIITKGTKMDVDNWGSTIADKDNITPEQIAALNTILESNGINPFVIPTVESTTKDDEGNDVTTTTQQSSSLYDLLESVDDEDTQDALASLGFYTREGGYAIPHRETYEEMMARREQERMRIDLAAQQKALARQQARLGLADLAAGIGDIIKASGGALVDKRSYQDMYNQLTAQQQKNFDGYLARMEALKEAEKAKQKEAADRARQERLLKEQRLYNEQLQQRQWAHDEDVLEQKHKNKIAEIKARGEQKIKEINERNKNQIDKFNNAGALVFDGIDYTFDKAHNNNVISQLLPIVSNYFTEENDYISAIAGIEDSVMSEYGKAGERANIVVSALKDFEYQFSQEDRDKIVRILTEYSNSRKNVSSAKGGESPVEHARAEQMYRNKDTGEKVTKSEWDTYRPSKKKLYEPVTA